MTMIGPHDINLRKCDKRSAMQCVNKVNQKLSRKEISFKIRIF